MIVEFTVKNFRSIKEEQIFSLYAASPGTHLTDNITYPDGNKIGVLKSVGVYGANASGKSNLLLAFEALQFIILHSGDLKQNDVIPCYESYKLSTVSETAPICFDVEFFTPDKKRYIYKIIFNKERILKEELSYFSSAKSSILFQRDESDTWETIKFGSLFTGGKKRFPFFSNNSYLSKAGNSAGAPESVRNIYNYFREEVLRLGLNEVAMLRNWHERKSLLNKVAQLLAFSDTGITGVSVKESDIDTEALNFPDDMPEPVKASLIRNLKRKYLFSHRTDMGETSYFEKQEESAGTQKLFDLAPLIVVTLEDGGVLLIDELDNSMHPFMAEMIIKLFNDPEVNQKGGQLIFSTHNINLMSEEHFRRDQIWFAEKDNGASKFYSLDDFDKKKVKPTSPFNRWYAEGRFGAVPNIDYQSIAKLLKQSREA